VLGHIRSAAPDAIHLGSAQLTLRLLRLSSSKGGLDPSAPRGEKRPRNGSPSGGSTLTTSAPQSPSSADAAGPATHMPTSTTQMPSIGPGMTGIAGHSSEPGSGRPPLSTDWTPGVTIPVTRPAQL
jgi:hypothetical protein